MQKLLKLPNKIYKYAVAALVLMVPLYPKFPAISVAGTYVAIRLEDFLVLFVFLIFFATQFRKFKSFFRDDINRAILIFLSVGAASLISGIFLTQSVTFHIGLLHWLRRVEYITVFWVGAAAIRNTRGLDFYLKLFGITVILAFIYGLGQKYLSWPVIITQNLEYSKGIALRWIPGSHINSTFAGHYDLATFLVMLLPIFVCLYFAVKGLRSKLFLVLIITSGLWLLVNTISRISIVSYLVGVTVSLLVLRKTKALVAVLILSIVFFSFSSDLISRYVRIIDITKSKIEQQLDRILINSRDNLTVFAQAEEDLPQRRIKKLTPIPTPPPVYEDRSTSIRLNVEWPRAIRAFSKNPLLGTGYSSITLATDNDYLRMLGETGLLGFFAFFLIFARVGKLYKTSLTIIPQSIDKIRSAFLAGVIGASPAIFLNAFFIDVFEASKFAIIFWLLMGIFVSTVRLAINEQND